MKATLVRSLTAMLFLVVSFGLAQYNPKLTKEEIAQLEALRKSAALVDVFHTNGNLWITYNTEGDIGRCNATVPSYTYPGGSVQYYDCRGGIWVTARGIQTQLVNANSTPVEFLAGESGFYTNSGVFAGNVTYNGWADPNNPYSKEPWRTETVYGTEAGIRVTVNRYSWSYPGKSSGRYFKVGDVVDGDYNDFVIGDYRFEYTGDLNGDGTPEAFAAARIDQLVIGVKADHDCSWNVGEAGFEENFWEDDMTEYDPVEGISYVRDDDNPTTAEDDIGIDDPKREYRDVRVGHVFLYAEDASGAGNFQLWDGTQYRTVAATKENVTHYWWSGANDPTTPLKRFLFSSAVFNANDEVSSDAFTYDPSHQGDLKDPSERPAAATDMRYGMGIGPFTLQLGQSARVIVAEIAGSGIANVQRAARAAKDAMTRTNRFSDLAALAGPSPAPTPPPAPQVTTRVTLNAAVEVTWTDASESVADFAGYIIYRAVQWPPYESRTLYEDEGLDPNLVKAISKPFAGDTGGPYKERIRTGGAGFPQKVGTTYTYVDTDVIPGFRYWYYVAAYDNDGYESARTLCYAFQDPGNGTPIPVAPPQNAVSFAAASSSAFASEGITVVPNPWTPDAPPAEETIKFFGLPQNALIRVYDVSGALIWDRFHSSTDGSEIWDMFSNARQRVVSGVYFARVENLANGDVKFAKFVIARE